MKRWVTFLGLLAASVMITIFIVTDPGEIRASVGANGDYTKVIRARAAKSGQHVVWVGHGLMTKVNGVQMAMLPYSAPILFDKEDIGRPFDKIRNRQTRREIEGALKSQNTLATLEGSQALSQRIDAAMSVASAGKVSQISSLQFGANGAERIETDPLPPKPGGNCGLGDPECPGCYTDLGTVYGIQFCGYACVNCRPQG
ncbi:MAG: hypothetical protein HY049_13440 [Acidobacteria bacterium]|nr:hypothetical protein [Acidobacteriota bacterium]